MECIMLSVEDIAAVKVAIQVCNLPEIKKEILCAPGSDYDINESTVPYYNRKKLWDEIVQKKATVMIEKLGIAKPQQGKVMGIVLLAGLRMLTWAEYHEGTLGISREYSFSFLNCSFFTQKGIIDNKKAAEELMKDEILNTKQKYKLACLNCFVDSIPVLYKQMTKEDKKEFYEARSSVRINQPELVKFWSYYLMGEVDKLKGEKNLDQYRLEKAVKSGSKASVEYCLEITKVTRKMYALIVAAMEAVKCRYSGGNWGFRGDRPKLWVPNDFYVDILCFLLSKMGEDQQIEFLKQDITGAKYKRDFLGDQKRSILIEYFLDWPYQDYFMKTVKLMWEFLPENDYSVLLLRICDKIKPRKEGSLKYGEERSYDYRDLLREFWNQSPERYKRYVFSNHEVECEIQRMYIRTKAGLRLIIELLTFDNYTCMDGKNIQLILSSARDQEKNNFISSQEWRYFCFRQMVDEKWGMLDRIVLNCFLTEDKYKYELCFTKEAKRACIDFIKNAKWNAVETFIKWSSLSEEEIKKLKKEMIHSKDGRNACVNLFSNDNKFEPVDQFIRWCVSSEEEVKEFRKEFVFSDEGTHFCAYFVEKCELELASEFIMFCLSSEREVVELKKKVAHRFGGRIFENLISHRDLEKVYNSEGKLTAVSDAKFKGSKWEQVEQVLTWCFSSEEEMSDFKKNVLLKDSGKEIHFNLIELYRWDEAETFFAWLCLSTEEIKELKKDTLFHYYPARETVFDIIYGEESIDDYGNREEAIELLFRWYLTDTETVLEFKGEFIRKFLEDVSEKDECVLSDFDSMIEQRLRDLNEEVKGVKRKSVSDVYPCKRFCNLKRENTGIEYGEIR